MGYYAQGEGHVTIPKADQEDCFLAAMTTLTEEPVGCDEESADNLTELLECLFEVVDVEGDTFWLRYNEKYGESWMSRFLQAIAPFVTEGVLDWRGESGSIWRHRFHEGDVVGVAAVVTYIDDPADLVRG